MVLSGKRRQLQAIGSEKGKTRRVLAKCSWISLEGTFIPLVMRRVLSSIESISSPFSLHVCVTDLSFPIPPLVAPQSKIATVPALLKKKLSPNS